MARRMVSLIMAALMAVLMLAVPAMAEDDDTPMESGGYYYVTTDNGKDLNVRDMPGGTIVGQLAAGSRIFCYYNEEGWALIDFDYNKPGYGQGTYACFVNSRFLSREEPAAEAAEEEEVAAADTLEDVNREFLSAKKVEPFAVLTRPTRVSGWVNIRWAPSTSAEIMATCVANTRLTVIRETENWYQVQNPETGDVGFVKKDYVAR